MVAITPATLVDLHRLIELEGQLFSSDRISNRQFKYLLAKANSIFVKAEHLDHILGYMVLLKRKNSRGLRIYSVGVSESARKQGVGRRLLTYAEHLTTLHCCTRLTLEVCEHNAAAIQLYSNFGFSVFGQKVNYYQDGCTALLLKKTIYQ